MPIPRYLKELTAYNELIQANLQELVSRYNSSMRMTPELCTLFVNQTHIAHAQIVHLLEQGGIMTLDGKFIKKVQMKKIFENIFKIRKDNKPICSNAYQDIKESK